jgi:hypothetical protein
MIDDHDDTLVLPPGPASGNDNAVLSTLDARLLGYILEVLEHAQSGYVERELFDQLAALEPDSTPADINGALRDAQLSGYVVCRVGRLYLERRMTREQLRFVKQLLALLEVKQP